MRPRRPATCIATLFCLTLAPAVASAQDPPSRLWFVGGATSTTILASCEQCPEDPATYRHTGSVLVNAGGSINPRTDLGAELLLVASTATGTDQIRVAFLMGSVQFRPWQSKGFFVKGGAGMAFVRNWILTTPDREDSGIRSKAFGLGLASGWEWRVSRHVGAQALGALHVAALGDLELAQGTVDNVMGNFWSVGAAIVVR
jgi:hypothetical protein